MDSENGRWLEWLRRVTPRSYIDLAKVLGGSFSRNLLRGLFKLLVAGFLTAQAFGILRSILSFFRIIVSLADLGLNYTLITFVAGAGGEQDALRKQQVLKTILVLKIAVVAVLMTVGNLLAPWLTVVFLSDPGLTFYIRLVFLAAGGQLLCDYISSYLSAEQRFGRLGFFLVTLPALMMLGGLALAVVERLNLSTSILIYLFAPTLTVLLWWPAVDRGFIKTPGWSGPLIRKLLRFSGWIYVESVASAVRNNISPLLLKNARLSGSVAAGELNAGLYGFGSDLANEIAIFSKSLLTVLLPKASARQGPKELRKFVKRAYRYLLLIIVPLGLLGFAAKPFLLLLGSLKPSYLEYLPSLRIFAILYAGALFSVASVPISTALYALKRPQVIGYVEMISIVPLLVGSVLIIPHYGGEGAAIMVGLQRVFSFVVLIVYGLIALRRAEAKEHGRGL